MKKIFFFQRRASFVQESLKTDVKGIDQPLKLIELNLN